MAENTFDAIVIGSGMSGGWAAKELCEAGFKTLVLERGRMVEHLKDYPTATKNPWDFPHRDTIPYKIQAENPVVSRCYAFGESTEHFFVKDTDHPYIQEKPFDWIRGYQVGGKSLLWARQVQRWSKFDFDAPRRDKAGIEWPISYDDIASWYSRVEEFIGVSGNKDGLETLPDGEFLPPWEMNAVEKHIANAIYENFDDRTPIIGRCAHLTEVKDIHRQQGRGKCMARSLCERGCPFGAYYSSTSSTIPWAQKTGNMTLQTDAIVESILYDEESGKASGVRVIDSKTGEKTDYQARVVFVNAACLNTNLILLNSTSERFPNGLGNDNGLLGKYVAFHNYRGKVAARYNGYMDTYYTGRRPTSVMMPNFRNVYEQNMPFNRGYQVHFSASRMSWGRQTEGEQFGEEYKKQQSVPGEWSIYMMMQGETVPKEENHVRLSKDQTDEWGMPQLITSIGYDENDELVMKDFHEQGVAMLEKAGCYDIRAWDTGQAPGLDIHEMGGVRMGKDPATSLLNEWNQLHLCKNVFVTDGAAMTTTGNQNPSLTFMALTARAATYAAEQMKSGAL